MERLLEAEKELSSLLKEEQLKQVRARSVFLMQFASVRVRVLVRAFRADCFCGVRVRGVVRIAALLTLFGCY